MRINPEEALPQTVTILNKLKKADSSAGSDVWVKHTLKACVWATRSHSQQIGNTTNVGASVMVQIPDRQDYPYMPYDQWKAPGAQDGAWTVSQDDYLVLGDVPEDVTSANITKTLAAYEPNCCKVRLFEDLTLPGNSAFLGGFLEQYASIYYIEGV